MNEDRAPGDRIVSIGMEKALARWAEAVECALLVLFGSAATGQARESSDLDLAVLFDDLPGPERRLRMIGEVQDICGSRMVEIVFLRPETNPVLRFEVFRSGRPIYEAVRGRFVSETVRALGLYEDALPFRRRLRERIAGAGSP